MPTLKKFTLIDFIYQSEGNWCDFILIPKPQLSIGVWGAADCVIRRFERKAFKSRLNANLNAACGG